MNDTSNASDGTVTDSRRPANVRRVLQLALATVWLLDGVLQLQPFMFAPGSSGFSGMLGGMAAGNPHVVAQTITWNASLIDHHAVATDAAFALIQILIGFGIAWLPTLKAALGASIVWSLGVWWFGEGLGGVLHGAGTPIGGGPGAVLFYALLAVMLWPADRSGPIPTFAAAHAIGQRAAKVVWGVVWVGMAFLALIGSGRSPQGTQGLIASLDSRQPGWLAAIDRNAESLVAHHGLVVPAPAWRATLVLAIFAAAAIWVVGENFGMILAGGATDPNSGPLLILLALAYWPMRPRPVIDPAISARKVVTFLPVEVA
jgi:hypothetical protein